jgi:hypothetical protein
LRVREPGSDLLSIFQSEKPKEKPLAVTDEFVEAIHVDEASGHEVAEPAEAAAPEDVGQRDRDADDGNVTKPPIDLVSILCRHLHVRLIELNFDCTDEVS